MKINSKGFIEPEVGEEFNLIGGSSIIKTVLDNNVLTCYDCIFLNNTCILPCLSEDRDDKNDVIYKEITDEKL